MEKKEPSKKSIKEQLFNLSADAIYAIIFIVVLQILLISAFLIFGKPTDTPIIKQLADQTKIDKKINSQISILGSLPALGNSTSSVSLIEFSDFECPFCRDFYKDTEKTIIENYVKNNKINLYYRDFPITQIHPKAELAALAARCANEQGNFWEMHDLLFEKSNEWIYSNESAKQIKFLSYAPKLNISEQKFGSCYANKSYLGEIQKDTKDASLLGFGGTPSFIILVPKVKTIKMKENIDSINANQPAQLYSSIILAEGNEDYIIKIQGSQNYLVFKKIFDSINFN